VSEQDDKVFIRRFSGIIVALVVLTLVIALVAYSVNRQLPPGENPSRVAAAAERTAPVAGVYTGEDGQQAVAEMQMAAVEETPAPAAESDIDGESIYNQVCMVCHMSGVAGAPIPGSDLWAERAAKGLDELVSNAVNGINAMPPKGGRTDLTDEQVRTSVEFMLAQ